MPELVRQRYELVAAERVERCIFFLRGEKVLLDRDLAVLYGVSTGNLNKAVQRNRGRFPADFMFRLTTGESAGLSFHFGISNGGGAEKAGRGGRRYLPYAFTEQGVAMLSSVLRSERAVRVNIEIMRAFVRLRGMLAAHKELAGKLAEMEKKYDAQFKVVFDALRGLMNPPEPPSKGRMGFHPT
jgi:hypothetical protein